MQHLGVLSLLVGLSCVDCTRVSLRRRSSNEEQVATEEARLSVENLLRDKLSKPPHWINEIPCDKLIDREWLCEKEPRSCDDDDGPTAPPRKPFQEEWCFTQLMICGNYTLGSDMPPGHPGWEKEESCRKGSQEDCTLHCAALEQLGKESTKPMYDVCRGIAGDRWRWFALFFESAEVGYCPPVAPESCDQVYDSRPLHCLTQTGWCSGVKDPQVFRESYEWNCSETKKFIAESEKSVWDECKTGGVYDSALEKVKYKSGYMCS